LRNKFYISQLKNRNWWTVIILAGSLAVLLITAQRVSANLYPEYLKNGRTYDQESDYIQWNGSVSYINLYHRDNTNKPPSEGGASCNNGCTEQVTRIHSGSSVSGNFTYLKTFSVQVAYSGDSDVGTAVIKACGKTILTQDLYLDGSSAPGFNNFPTPAWNVTTAGDCTWSISASGGYVDFRAVTTTYRTTSAPTVDLKVNNSDGPLSLSEPAGYTLTWTSTNAASCTASEDWSGAQKTAGSLAFSNVAGGSYTYTLTCDNPSGSASDSVTVNVLGAPTVSVSAPAALTAPASYTATWMSSNAASCTGSDRFVGLTGLSGSKVEAGLPIGTYDYTVTCTNAVGLNASDTKRTVVYAAPEVDLKVDGMDGPILTRTSPISYTANWTSTNATQCTGSARLAGYSGLTGSRFETNVSAGTTYDYTVTCQNAAGATATDTIRMIVVAAPSVDVKVNSSDGPLSFFEPANFTISWTSANSSSCSAVDDLPGPVDINGSRLFSNILQGAYRYTVQCANAAGTTAIDSVLVNVNPLPPIVDLKIEGGDAPVIRPAPAEYTLSWTSQYATSCRASSSNNDWDGTVNAAGNQAFSDIPIGSRTYTLTCSNVSGTASDSVTANVIAPLSGSISALYAKLVLYAPKLGQPAQTLSGSVSGGAPAYAITVHVRAPSGATNVYTRSSSDWSIDQTSAGDTAFGTTEEGTWTAWATISDAAGKNFQTGSVTWEVSWYPVHGRP
jgi:hypothetical protein